MTIFNVSGVTNVALNGYDPVSFFKDEDEDVTAAVDHKPTHGNFEISTTTQDGVTYYFMNSKNKALFESDPEKYSPQMGGFCAYGVAQGAVFPVDLATAQVYKGKLYINLNPDIQALFNQDLDKNIKKAEQNWVKLGKQ